MSTLIVTIPRALWLTANRPAQHMGARARVVGALHDLAVTESHTARLTPVRGPVVARWTVHYPRGVGWTHGDAANAAPTTKALLDGLVSVGVLAGDGPLVVTEERFRRGENLTRPGVHVIDLDLMEEVDL